MMRAGSFMQTTGCGSPSGCSPLSDPAGAGGVGSTHTASSILQGQAVPGPGWLCRQGYIRVTAAGRPGTGPAGPQAKARVSVTETVSRLSLHEFIQTNAVKCSELQCQICKCAGEMQVKWLNLFACRFEWSMKNRML